ncbi:hypothetical protein K501DRAFT_240329 [Backusella circina FSU 941]|nr:hypothetical protein K501DRAFT_240329 [Backusella circina FSU 941]
MQSSESPSYTSNTLGTKRTRISRACDVCRRKKIKCDVDGESPCTTCKQYNWECTFNDTAKKRGPPKGYIDSLETRLRKMESLLEKIQPDSSKSKAQQAITKNVPIPAESSSPIRELPPIQMPTSVEHSKIVRYLGSSSGYYLVSDILDSKESDGGDKMTPAEVAAAENQRRSSLIQTENLGPVRFRKINVDDDDVLFVRDKTLEEHVDQLQTDKRDLDESIASKAVLDELVKKFFEINFVSLPLVDKDEFMDGYEGRIEPPPAPILTYAICSYACIVIPLNDPIFERHNVDRNKLFDTLVEHTTYLVRKEYLTPRIATIQALVLLCSYRSCDNSFYKNWLRTGMSVRMAQELGLHRSLEKVPLSEAQVESNKRLWYCIYCVDRWCCASMGRPLAIADADCDIDLPHIRGGENGTKDYSLFINFIKLSGILGEVLRRIYSPRAKSQGYNTVQSYHTVQSIYRMLNDWLGSIPEQQRISPEEARSTYGATILSTKMKEAGPLMTCYYVVVILLYRSFLVSDPNDVYPQLYKESSERCTDAAKSVVDIARLIQPIEIVHFGWNFSGYAVFQASLIHVYNCTSSVPEVAETARQYIHICIEECIKPLNDEMSNGPQALPLLHTLMSLIGVERKEAETNPINSANSNGFNSSTTIPFIASANTINPSPMSVQTIVSGWDNEIPKVDNASTAAWQCLFSSAATPFFENEADWQATLASLFDETAQ